MKSPLIHTHDLNFAFGKFKVLTDINLSVPEGSIFGFLGPNGAGKLMFAQPVARGYYYLSKLFFLLLVLGSLFLLKFILSLLSVYFIVLYKPKFEVHEFLSVWPDFLIPELKIFLSCFLLISVQYWLSLRAKNFVVPFGIGTFAAILPLAVFIILGIAGIISSPEKLHQFLRFDPYSLPFSFVFDFAGIKNSLLVVQIPVKFIIVSVAAGMIVGTAGYLDLRGRNIQ